MCPDWEISIQSKLPYRFILNLADMYLLLFMGRSERGFSETRILKGRNSIKCLIILQLRECSGNAYY